MEMKKIWGAFTSLFVAVGIIFCWLYLEQVDRANERYQGARAVIESTRSTLAAKKLSLEKRQAAQLEGQRADSELNEANEEYAAAETLRRDAQVRESNVRRRIRMLVTEMTELVVSRRSNAGQKEYASVDLRNGKSFKSAKVRKIEDDSVTFAHMGGVGVARVEELPEAILAEFDLGPNAIVPQLREFEARLDRAPDDSQPEPPPVLESAKPAPKGLSANDRIRLKNAQLALVDARAKLDVGRYNLNLLAQQNDQAGAAIVNAQQRGVPTTNLRIAQQKIQAAIISANAYITAMEAEISKIQLHISELSARQ